MHWTGFLTGMGCGAAAVGGFWIFHHQITGGIAAELAKVEARLHEKLDALRGKK